MDHRTDGGMYEAINKGFRLANGKSSPINSDDCYFPWTVSTAVQALSDFRVRASFSATCLTLMTALSPAASSSIRHFTLDSFDAQDSSGNHGILPSRGAR